MRTLSKRSDYERTIGATDKMIARDVILDNFRFQSKQSLHSKRENDKSRKWSQKERTVKAKPFITEHRP